MGALLDLPNIGKELDKRLEVIGLALQRTIEWMIRLNQLLRGPFFPVERKL